MKKNVGGIDRVLRIVAGLALIALASDWPNWSLGVARRGCPSHGCV